MRVPLICGVVCRRAAGDRPHRPRHRVSRSASAGESASFGPTSTTRIRTPQRFFGGQIRARMSPRTRLRAVAGSSTPRPTPPKPCGCVRCRSRRRCCSIPSAASFSPYVLGGGGWYATRVELLAGDETLTSETTREFGWHAGFGAELRLGPHAGLHGDYRYTFLDFGDDDDEDDDDGGLSDALPAVQRGSMWTVGLTLLLSIAKNAKTAKNAKIIESPISTAGLNAVLNAFGSINFRILGILGILGNELRALTVSLCPSPRSPPSPREGVDLFERGVDVRRDPRAFVFGVDDRRGDDAPACPQPFDDFGSRHAGDLNRANRARMRRIELRVDPHLRVGREPRRPPIPQVAQPRRLPLDADAFMKRQRLGNRIVVGGRMGADLLELADVVVLRGRGRRQRPERRNQLAPDVEEAGADRRQQPLVQAGAVEIAPEIRTPGRGNARTRARRRRWF